MTRSTLPRWSITALTVPGREAYLEKLLRSLATLALPKGTEVVVVYNAKAQEARSTIDTRMREWSGGVPLRVYFNERQPTIASGRNLQLAVCAAPLICFIDDDLTLHGPVFEHLESTLRTRPLALVGVPSLRNDTDEPFKPRPSTPSVEIGDVQYMTVQGMLAAGYRDLLLDLGGFNERRGFWGEWTEMNLRLWRNGYPTGYQRKGGYLRHWEDAPHSPTRSLTGREMHVLWGLVCTAIEYEADASTPDADRFWQLIEERYLPYAFGDQLNVRSLLNAFLALLPRLTAEWSTLMAFRDEARRHPFPFKPFHELTREEVERVLDHATVAILPYRRTAWPPRALARRGFASLFGRRAPPHPETP